MPSRGPVPACAVEPVYNWIYLTRMRGTTSRGGSLSAIAQLSARSRRCPSRCRSRRASRASAPALADGIGASRPSHLASGPRNLASRRPRTPMAMTSRRRGSSRRTRPSSTPRTTGSPTGSRATFPGQGVEVRGQERRAPARSGGGRPVRRRRRHRRIDHVPERGGGRGRGQVQQVRRRPQRLRVRLRAQHDVPARGLLRVHVPSGRPRHLRRAAAHAQPGARRVRVHGDQRRGGSRIGGEGVEAANRTSLCD